MTNEELNKYLSEKLSDHLLSSVIDKEHVVVECKADQIIELTENFKDNPDLNFDMLMDMTAVDWLETDREPRFDVVYHFYSTKLNHRVRVKIATEENAHVPSLDDFYKIADWFEREIWDLYGIRFSGHPNLKRLLLYEEFEGHPLRKDYDKDHRQPLMEKTWPSRDSQVQMDKLGIHRP